MTTPGPRIIAPHGLPSPDGRFLWDADSYTWEPKESWKPRAEAAAMTKTITVEALAAALHDEYEWEQDMPTCSPEVQPRHIEAFEPRAERLLERLAVLRYSEALSNGLSDPEAREEGWPSAAAATLAPGLRKAVRLLREWRTGHLPADSRGLIDLVTETDRFLAATEKENE